jgi:ribonuclease VapC
LIIDTSAVIAILKDEPEAPGFARAIADAAEPKISAVSYVEAAAVLDRAEDPLAGRELDHLLEVAGATVEPVTVAHAKRARAAYRDFGRGSGHPASLNFGDCFSYALAIEAAKPLLFKGDDFSRTDVVPVRP